CLAEATLLVECDSQTWACDNAFFDDVWNVYMCVWFPVTPSHPVSVQLPLWQALCPDLSWRCQHASHLNLHLCSLLVCSRCFQTGTDWYMACMMLFLLTFPSITILLFSVCTASMIHHAY